MNQLFELIEIQTTKDLPTEIGKYLVEYKDGSNAVLSFTPTNKDKVCIWLKTVRCYLRPVQVSKEVVYVEQVMAGWLRKTELLIVKV